MNVERMRYIRKLQQSMLAHVYTHQKRSLAEKMGIYAIRNQTLLLSNSNTFIFNSIWYSAGDSTQATPDYKPNRELHPELKEKVIFLFEKTFELKTQEASLLSHFGQVLITANRAKDLMELLPYPLHDMVSMIDNQLFNSGPLLTKQEINQFKEDNHDGITVLNSMLLLELLLSK